MGDRVAGSAGVYESILGPHLEGRPDQKYLLGLIRDMDAGRLDARIDIISAALRGPLATDTTGAADAVDFQAFM